MASLEFIATAVIYGLLIGGIYALLSIGLTLLLGVLGTINLAHGDFMMLVMYTTFWLYSLYGVDPFLTMVFSVPIFFIIGVGVQKYFMMPLKTVENQVLVTYALAVFLENIVLALWSPDHKSITSTYTKMSLTFYFLTTSFLRVLSFVIALGIAFALFIFITRVRSGKTILAVAQDKIAAKLMGIDTSRVHLMTFGLATALTAVAGCLLAQIIYTFPTVGFHFTIIALVVMVLAGSGNIQGAVFGSLLIGIVESLSGVFMGIGYKEMIVFIIFILVLLFKPEGLFGKRTARRA